MTARLPLPVLLAAGAALAGMVIIGSRLLSGGW